jgi:hypothetical protein
MTSGNPWCMQRGVDMSGRRLQAAICESVQASDGFQRSAPNRRDASRGRAARQFNDSIRGGLAEQKAAVMVCPSKRDDPMQWRTAIRRVAGSESQDPLYLKEDVPCSSDLSLCLLLL